MRFAQTGPQNKRLVRLSFGAPVLSSQMPVLKRTFFSFFCLPRAVSRALYIVDDFQQNAQLVRTRNIQEASYPQLLNDCAGIARLVGADATSTLPRHMGSMRAIFWTDAARRAPNKTPREPYIVLFTCALEHPSNAGRGRTTIGDALCSLHCHLHGCGWTD